MTARCRLRLKSASAAVLRAGPELQLMHGTSRAPAIAWCLPGGRAARMKIRRKGPRGHLLEQLRLHAEELVIFGPPLFAPSARASSACRPSLS
jgi:hypothetical protein